MSKSTTSTNLWDRVYGELRTLFAGEVFEMWFENLSCVGSESNVLSLEAPSDFNAIWIESNYLDVIERRASELAGCPISVNIDTAQAAVEKDEPISSKKREARLDGVNGGSIDGRKRRSGNGVERNGASRFLNTRNTFESFIVGSGNQLAHAASIAVANAPGRAYNPLFVFGETGLGKTHLMHAVAHQMLQNNPEARIAYMSTEKFTNEFIHAIREQKLTKFRQYYRNVDVLLVDDIHFLSGKDSTQEEFFHTFNELFEAGKQIFLASDRPANEIEKLENRLISRFQWGLVTDIQPPDFETRVAILKKKAETMNIRLSEEIMHFLAERVSRNVRRMEGALTRINSYASLINKTLDLSSVEGLLGDLLHEETLQQVTIEQIQKKVADYFQIKQSDMLGRRRTNAIVFPRQIAMYICRTLTSQPLKEIGDAFGGRDHGTVIHACKQVENMVEQDVSVKRSVDYLSRQLSQAR